MEWIKKTGPNYMLDFKYSDLGRLKVKGWKKICHVKHVQQKQE